MPGPNPNTGRFRVIQGGRTSSEGCVTTGWKTPAPLEEKPVPLLEMRKKNRRDLAESYHAHHPPAPRGGWAPYPEAEKECRIESISLQKDVLSGFVDEMQMGSEWRVRDLGKKLRNGKTPEERGSAAEKLVRTASDCEIYGKEISLMAFRELATASHRYCIKEARVALESIGARLYDLPRLERIALSYPKIVLWFSSKLRRALERLEQKLEKGF
jgi:hypothetical protein